MTETKPDDPVEKLDRAVSQAERWRKQLGGEFEDRLDASKIRLAGQVEVFAAELDALVADGHRIELNIRRSTARITIAGDQGSYTEVKSRNLEAGFPENHAQVRAACNTERVAQLLKLCAELDGQLDLTVTNRPAESRFRWVRTIQGIVRQIEELGWTGLAFKLFDKGEPQRLVVADAGGEHLVTDRLLCHGPDFDASTSSGASVDTSPLSSQGRSYATAWHADQRAGLPPPTAFKIRRREGFDDLEPLFRRISQALTWTWIATSARLEDKRILIRFEGSQELDLSAAHQGPPAASGVSFTDDEASEKEALDLWRMAVASTDNLRHEAVQRAFSMTVRDGADLGGAAKRLHSMARYLFDLSQKNLVAETLRIRSDAQKEAVKTAEDATEAARKAAGVVIDRVFTQFSGALGLLFAKLANLITSPVAAWLLFAVVLLTLATGAVALLFALPGAAGMLASLDKDLKRFENLLRPEDLEEIRRMDRVQDAKAQIERARKTIWWIVPPAALVIGAMALATLWIS